MSIVALVSCVSLKRPAACAARDLYTSPLFRFARAYAEAHADRWFILSALHGLVAPDAVLAPYDVTLNTQARADRARWAERVLAQAGEVLPPTGAVLLLAGARYREFLVAPLQARGHDVRVPLAGLRLGRQLSWYKDRLGRAPGTHAGGDVPAPETRPCP